MGLEPHPAPRRCIERLPEGQRNSRVDGRHQNATLKDRNDGDNGYETAKRGRPSGEIVGIEAGWQPCLSLIHPLAMDIEIFGASARRSAEIADTNCLAGGPGRSETRLVMWLCE